MVLGEDPRLHIYPKKDRRFYVVETLLKSAHDQDTPGMRTPQPESPTPSGKGKKASGWGRKMNEKKTLLTIQIFS